MPTGTIFGVFGHDDSCDVNDPDACLIETIRSGSNLVASGYCLYGSSTFLMFTMGNGAYGFTLDENVGEFILSHPDIKIPERSSTYSFNEARERMWEDPVRDVVAKWRAGTGKSARIFSSRYVGSMVGDVHRTLLNGGIFGYPADDMYPEGKLRLLYEGAPMSFLMEQAGGMSTTGRERVMDVQPSYVHQRVPIMMGSAEDVREIIEACKEWDEGIGL
uniref:fructose-bisphosphatase n=1 Tax=Corethron hystrix TaxID=216773 RepID=A0A6U5E2N6_9STRA|mmetsp:Transcript_15560/g.34989  ORF Transcript_15560/g.34989 Transcript_15560/m.34989 type:complete len:218 (+) Transcript_15560:793-1446(+)